MRSCNGMILLSCLILSAAAVSFAQQQSFDEARPAVEQLCQNQELIWAWHVAIKSLLHHRARCGNSHSLTAECLTIVADMAKRREKYHLARLLYRKALSIQEKELGPANTEVVRCKRALADLPEK